MEKRKIVKERVQSSAVEMAVDKRKEAGRRQKRRRKRKKRRRM